MQTRLNLSTPTLVSLGAVALIALVMVINGWNVINAAFVGSDDGVTPSEFVDSYVAKASANLELYGDRIDGRSVFFEPPRRIVKRPPPPVRVSEPEERDPVPQGPPPKQAAPSSYRGPNIVFVLGNEIWFEPEGGEKPQKRVRIGEKVDDYTYVAFEFPHTVKVTFAKEGYEDGSYDVEVFDNWEEDAGIQKSDPKATTKMPGIVEVSENDTTSDDDGDKDSSDA